MLAVATGFPPNPDALRGVPTVSKFEAFRAGVQKKVERNFVLVTEFARIQMRHKRFSSRRGVRNFAISATAFLTDGGRAARGDPCKVEKFRLCCLVPKLPKWSRLCIKAPGGSQCAGPDRLALPGCAARPYGIASKDLLAFCCFRRNETRFSAIAA